MTTSRRRYYNVTGDGYESGRYGDSHMEGYRGFRNATLLHIIQSHLNGQPARILEVGCGTGLSLEFLAAQPAPYSLYGVDASETMLKQAAQKAAALERGARLAIGDAGRLPYTSGFFDVVFATRFIHQFEHQTKRELWQEFQRVGRRGALIIVEFYARPYHRLRYYAGGAKGRSMEAYLTHFPTRREVDEIAGDTYEIYPLRLPGSRVLAGILGEPRLHRLTDVVGRATNRLFLDEYFVVARGK